MIARIDHIGIAVKSIAAARRFYEEALGLTCEKIEIVESQKVKTAFFSVGDTHIELLEPTSSESAVAKFIDKNGEGVHHIAYGCDDVMDQLDQASSAGVQLIHKEPIVGAGGKLVAFMHPKSSFGVLTELCSKGSE